MSEQASAKKQAAARKPRRVTRKADVVVIGAGLAGLRAARAVLDGGASAVVLEARDRVGGRTHSQRVGAATFDVGGQWIGPTQDRLAGWVRELGVRTFATHHEGTKILDLDGELATYQGDIPAVSLVKLADLQQSLWRTSALSRRVPVHDPASARHARQWDRSTVEEWRRKVLFTRDVQKMFDVAVRVVFGAEPEELSVLHFLFYAHAGGGFRKLIDIAGGAQQDRFVDGAQAVSQRMADPLGDALILGSPVRSVVHEGGGVKVTSDRATVRAKRAIIALPPALVRRIEFDPPLPASRDQLLQRLPMGSTAKVICGYADAFWRNDGYSGEVVCADGPLSVVFDNTSHDGAQPALLAFLCGRDARRWSRLPDPERRDIVLSALARYFGRGALSPSHYVEKIWDADPWSGGCPVAVAGPGVHTGFSDALRDPIGRLHFAGTETATVWNGYMEGALESGERAAREVLVRL